MCTGCLQILAEFVKRQKHGVKNWKENPLCSAVFPLIVDKVVEATAATVIPTANVCTAGMAKDFDHPDNPLRYIEVVYSVQDPASTKEDERLCTMTVYRYVYTLEATRDAAFAVFDHNMQSQKV